MLKEHATASFGNLNVRGFEGLICLMPKRPRGINLPLLLWKRCGKEGLRLVL